MSAAARELPRFCFWVGFSCVEMTGAWAGSISKGSLRGLLRAAFHGKKEGAMRAAMCVLMAALGVGLAGGSAAMAQNVRISSRMELGGAGGGEISRRSLEGYALMLGLSEDQAAAARTVWEGYDAEYQRAVDAQRQAMQETQRRAQDTGDQAVFMEKLPEIQKEFRERTAKIEAGFFRDLKDLLSAEQESAWEKVTRARRREVGLRGQPLSGAGVDLVAVVREQKAADEVRGELAPVMEQYEGEMDRVLRDAEKLRDSGEGFSFAPGLDVAKIQERSKAWREIGLRLREINERTRAKIDGVLPEGARAGFAEAYRRLSMPLVYRPARVMRELERAMKMEDVSAGQRETLASIRERYQREAEGANNAWAAAIRAAEEKDQAGSAVVLPGGGQMMLNMEEDPQDLREARKARADLDDRTRDAVRRVLTPAQKDRLERQGAEEEGAGGGAGEVMMFRTGG